MSINLLEVEGETTNNAEYGVSSLLKLENISLNNGNINAIADNGLVQIANPGDANGDSNYSDFDVLLVSEVAAGVRDGLDEFNSINPLNIADVNGDGIVSAFDAYLIAQQNI